MNRASPSLKGYDTGAGVPPSIADQGGKMKVRKDMDGTGHTCGECVLIEICKKKWPKTIDENRAADSCNSFREKQQDGET